MQLGAFGDGSGSERAHRHFNHGSDDQGGPSHRLENSPFNWNETICALHLESSTIFSGSRVGIRLESWVYALMWTADQILLANRAQVPCSRRT
jgi:hypothetical protein